MREKSSLELPQISNELWCLKNGQHLNMDKNFDHRMSLNKSKCLYSYNCLHFLNHAFPMSKITSNSFIESLPFFSFKSRVGLYKPETDWSTGWAESWLLQEDVRSGPELVADSSLLLDDHQANARQGVNVKRLFVLRHQWLIYTRVRFRISIL